MISIYISIPSEFSYLIIPKFAFQSLSLSQIYSFLQIPTSYRGFKPCTSPKSEITCSQLYYAYKTIKGWTDSIPKINNSTVSAKVIHIYPKCGIGNSMYHVVSGLLVAIALNRPVIIESNISGFDFNPLLNYGVKLNCKQVKHQSIQNFQYWRKMTFKEMMNYKSHYSITYCFPYFLLQEIDLAKFIYGHFGLHFVYYLSNFAETPSEVVYDIVMELFQSIPKSVKVFGAHVRTYSKFGDDFLTNSKRVTDLIVPFLKDKLKNKNYVALATEKTVYANLFQKEFGNRLIMLNMTRIPNGNKFDASLDILLLMNCDHLIGSWRSSFSSIVGMRTMKNIYYVCNENPKIFRMSNSQMGIVVGIHDFKKDYNYNINNRAYLTDKLEEPLRLFYRNEII